MRELGSGYGGQLAARVPGRYSGRQTPMTFIPPVLCSRLEALHHELAAVLWDLRECQAGREPWGAPLLVRGRPLADWLPLSEVARILQRM
jgi:hypothetical protein